MSGSLVGLAAGLPVTGLLGLQGVLGENGAGVVPGWLSYLVLAAAAGAVIGLFVPSGRGPAAAAAAGVLVGVLGWLVWWLTADPVLHGAVPTWSVAAAAASYPRLVAGLLHGALAGALLHGLSNLTDRRSGPRRPAPVDRPRVVIVGGGFAGVAAARRFERLSVHAASPDVTLISQSNFMLFTPMLAEAASGAVEPSHISVPVRAAAGHTRFRQGTVVDVDTDSRTVHLAGATGEQTVGYDHLVLAWARSRGSPICPPSRKTPSH